MVSIVTTGPSLLTWVSSLEGWRRNPNALPHAVEGPTRGRRPVGGAAGHACESDLTAHGHSTVVWRAWPFLRMCAITELL